MAKKRNRAISLSLDWDSMVKEGEESEKGSKAHFSGNYHHMTGKLLSFVREFVHWKMERTRDGHLWQLFLPSRYVDNFR
jgi:hypothetical protein